ncbi:alpha-(1,6)-fucosyltransferase-like isoform X1 [Pomacea canaliculata]|uniref:alpha-(1,6)-fucosyltransferase-like isoform X1 n=1 Tax=Pomacea canaliculata TaxID=400727 RepID=UPI000D72EDEB|nr:alpha-(1,6)-fucosyltransferase-like isoform X1 [Pomacea canaliculata]
MFLITFLGLVFSASSKSYSPIRILKIPVVDSLNPRPDILPLAIPKDLAPRLMTFHGDPPVWWIGQLLRYLMRPQKHLQENIEQSAKEMGFKKPIVGVHVRRTDKLFGEAAFHSLEEYMHHVEDYYQQLEHHTGPLTRRVYLATDDPNVLKEARENYRNYIFVYDDWISLAAHESRYTPRSLMGIILDIHFLSSSDYLVCTFSSQVCRVAYELMQTLHGDASTYFRSLDDSFYFGGQNAHNMLAWENYNASRNEEISLQVGDLVGIAGNHWDGFSKGTNRRTGQSGLYPSYKVVDNVVAVWMPLYVNVKDDENT